MITKFCIVCLCMTATSMLGLWRWKEKKRRVTYLGSLVKLTDTLIAEISFRKDNLFSVLTAFAESENGDLGRHIGAFCAAPYAPMELSGKLLTETEKREVTEFFSSLGGSDAATQLLELENRKRTFSAWYECEQEKFRKNGTVGLKLAALLGLAIGILLL